MAKGKINVRKYTRKVKGKTVHVKVHHRRMYKGYRYGKASRRADYRQHAKHAPANKFRKGIGHLGDW